MLTYQNSRIFLLVSFSVTIFLYEFGYISWYYLLISPILYIAAIVYGSATIQANFYMKSICKLPTNEKLLALTFDDGPDPIYTKEILTLLKDNKLKATFFIIGKKISGNESILKQMKDDGHVIANHSYSHSYFFDIFPTKKVLNDIRISNQLIHEVVGLTPKWFRPPYGVTNPNIAEALKDLGMVSVGWNLRSFDTIIHNKEKLNNRVLKRLKPGSIVLFHDTGKHSIEALKELISFTNKNGYKIVGLNEILTAEVYEAY